MDSRTCQTGILLVVRAFSVVSPLWAWINMRHASCRRPITVASSHGSSPHSHTSFFIHHAGLALATAGFADLPLQQAHHLIIPLIYIWISPKTPLLIYLIFVSLARCYWNQNKKTALRISHSKNIWQRWKRRYCAGLAVWLAARVRRSHGKQAPPLPLLPIRRHHLSLTCFKCHKTN